MDPAVSRELIIQDAPRVNTAGNVELNGGCPASANHVHLLKVVLLHTTGLSHDILYGHRIRVGGGRVQVWKQP